MSISELLISLDAESFRIFSEEACKRGCTVDEAVKQMALERASQIVEDPPRRARKGGRGA